jgi:tetratricopeptide (TPR) repeat protein
MPTYKQLPLPKKDQGANLPFYRPIDHLAFQVVEHRRKILPYVVVAVLAFALFGGFRAYSAHYEGNASQLLSAGQAEAVVKDYGRSKAARIARLKLGKTALDAKEYDRAIDWFTPVAGDQRAPALLRVSAQQNLAFAYLKKNDAAKALGFLEAAAKDPQNSSNDYTQLLIAYALESEGSSGTAGSKDKALVIYKTLSDGSKEPAVRAEAQARKKWLEPETQPAAPSSH